MKKQTKEFEDSKNELEQKWKDLENVKEFLQAEIQQQTVHLLSRHSTIMYSLNPSKS